MCRTRALELLSSSIGDNWSDCGGVGTRLDRRGAATSLQMGSILGPRGDISSPILVLHGEGAVSRKRRREEGRGEEGKRKEDGGEGGEEGEEKGRENRGWEGGKGEEGEEHLSRAAAS